ncbi:MAG: Fic family protein [Phycisphaerae bacterium]|nr:Fic family protein [Saprospiraceae bacterium]
MYIYQHPKWPAFTWSQASLELLLGTVRHRQGRLIGRMEALGFDLRAEAVLHNLTLDILKSNEIEGEMLDPEQVHSSVARRLGMDIAGLIPADRHVERAVEMMVDAAQNFNQPLTKDRLFGWHSALFPAGRSGMRRIGAGAWRDHQTGPMQVVSGPVGRERVHFVAPESEVLEKEMQQLMEWFNTEMATDPVLKAAIAHLWLLTIHPFDDGNGRIARTIADMQLARADGTTQRFYSMSAQIRQERSAYYQMLEKTQQGTLDITAWLEWFLLCLNRALEATEHTLADVLKKARFWQENTVKPFNDRQRLMLNKLLDGFEGKLTSSKWAKIAKCSQDTATRDIQSLIDQGILLKESAGGRSTSYVLRDGSMHSW